MPELDKIRSDFESGASGPLALNEYQEFARRTYKGDLDGEELFRFLLLGLHGEVGSLLSELKKKQRDRSAYVAYSRSAVEETGDVLWYLANVALVAGIPLSALAGTNKLDTGSGAAATFADLEPQAALFEEPASNAAVQEALLALAARTGDIVSRFGEGPAGSELHAGLALVFAAMVNAAKQAHVSIEGAATANLSKLLGRWPITRDHGKLYDEDFHPDEQIPRRFAVAFRERQVGSTTYAFQSLNGVNLGDRLTDNSAGGDDYRFHDIFHLAFAGILGWSPVLRSLLKIKRKSDGRIDEIEDGARAQITEEGISNWIFAHGLRHGAFENVDSLDFALLKTVQEMVREYEVNDRPLWMWEEAILAGFSVFRDLKRNRGGTVEVDLHKRSIEYSEADASGGG
ncbi:nucleoside triphosphate pyrophosphohydrolase family protein [Novosphingopyxis baekryungensis]|uniref:nucleoside triphosphate pyrophosphohydrolase family protein n=1 Tax=Novosphingopyxis baekryungensis TaxID=279369 RepID=UPI0003B71CF1|nr:nucleoside triphosphate pyrophosphohydrolase family protein [Novosphingopyxis baekryungensis]